MSHINSFVLSGRLGGAPESRLTSQNKPMCVLNLAHARWDAKQRAAVTEWYTVYVFDAEAERCLRVLRKGAHVLVEGRLNQRHWTSPEGKKGTRCDIVAHRVSLISSARQQVPEGASRETPATEPEDMFVF